MRLARRGLARAGGWVLRGPGGVLPWLDCDFAADRYWYNGAFYGSAAALVAAASGSFARASAAYDDAGTSYAANVLRRSASGVRIEAARANYLANPAAPATQNTASLAAGRYTLFVKGTGSAACSGGASGTATEAAPFSFTLASAAVVTVTPSGTLAWFNLQNQAYKTSPILAAAAGTGRAQDLLTLGLGGLTTSGGVTIVIEATNPDGNDNASGVFFQPLFTFTGTQTASVYRDRNSFSPTLSVNDGASTVVTASGGVQKAAPVRMAARIKANDHAVSVDGAGAAGITARGMPSITGLAIGSNGVAGWNKDIQRVAVFGTSFSNGELQAVSAQANSDVAIGDSLTNGFGATLPANNYPSLLGRKFTPAREVMNFGYSGFTSTQIRDVVLASPHLKGRMAVIWAGRNNYTSPDTVMADIASMLTYLNTTRYMVLTVINRPDLSSEWSGGAGYNAIVALNARIVAAYPNNYLDIRSLLVASYNASLSQDVIDAGHDAPPTSKSYDGLHQNDAGQAFTAQKVYDFQVAKGWA